MEDRLNKIQRENAEVEHLLFSPVRLLVNIAKWGGLIAVALITLAVNQVGWVVNLGARSEHARVVRAAYLQQQLRTYADDEVGGNEWAVYDIDFRVQPAPSADLDSYNRLWNDPLPWSQAPVWNHPSDNLTVKAFTTTWKLSGGMPGHGIPYCIPAMRPGFAAPYFVPRPIPGRTAPTMHSIVRVLGCIVTMRPLR